MELPEEVLPGYPDEAFVTYRDMRVFYKFKEQSQLWFVLVSKTGAEATVGLPTLGSHWFKTKREAIEWGKALIDAERDGNIQAQINLVLRYPMPTDPT